MKAHFNNALNPGAYSCPICGERGKSSMPVSTTDKKQVTCKKCLRVIAAGIAKGRKK